MMDDYNYERLYELEKERDGLRAELDAMKGQEPVAWMREQWGPDCGNYWELYLDDEMGWRDRKDWTPLYARPVPASVPRGMVVDRGFRFDSEKQHHVPTILIEFEPVPVGSPNDAKGWRDRDGVAALLAAAPEVK